ncbi:hypothetical protein FB567DRAFT_586466 [Paraphoma chrysanthemicola]|uniref:NACHT domain-containing protein n=1 Tax=Paraphoma chrysanthemicola TaxID=798071 RepID=A0A8K0W3Z1_9PLEO|nr:hypothetical protein FB567DRAFT_586466 [Paraphoma chrysanthemicola]
MRLVQIEDNGGFSLVEFASNEIPPYAILSHVWRLDQDEVTLNDLREGTGERKLGYEKLTFCGTQAARDGLRHFWLDTCCIDKSSSAELSESINSMFQWYRGSDKCYAYLADVSSSALVADDSSTQKAWKQAFESSIWFKRGWTLQELLAPVSVEFFSKEGDRLGDKGSMAQVICKITGINIRALSGTPLLHFSVAERFSWIANRKTKREEDEAYCLLGIFDVSMGAIYGEGRKKAFARLRKEMRESSEVEGSIFPETAVTQHGDETNIAFKNSISRFRSSLSSEEQQKLQTFDTYEKMQDSLTSSFTELRPEYAFRMMSKIHKFGRAWETSLTIMSTSTLAQSESIGFAWGAVHLVLTQGVKHKTYLSKIVTMLSNMGSLLPVSEAYLMMYAQQSKADSESECTTDTHHGRLHEATSNICADIVQFCQDVYKILRAPTDGIHCRRVSNLTWEPFHTRFSVLLDRLQSYELVFEQEIQLENSMQREHQYSKQAGQAELGKDVLWQIQQQLENLRSSNDRLEMEIISSYNKIERNFRERAHRDNSDEVRGWEYENMMRTKVSDIVNWIGAPDYAREFQKAQKTRLPESGGYMLADSTYQRWKLLQPPLQKDGSSYAQSRVHSSTILVQGKPGFGKTVLSSLLIEDLQEDFTPSIRTTPDHGYVFFYHFVSERRDCCTPYDAFRAVLAQIIQRYSYHQDTLDRIAILMIPNNVDGLLASDEEVFGALLLLLEGFNQSILIFDGIDECEDHTVFLEQLNDLCATTSTRLMLLGRPNIELPSKFAHQSIHLRDWNLRDIERFLDPQVRRWQDRGMIPNAEPTEKIVEELVSHSEGIFLWARLMSQFLDRKALSPKERLDIIFEPTEFTGLDGIYTKILEVLGQGYERETANIQRIFGLIAITLRPLSVIELQTAVAIAPGRVTEESNFIIDFETSLPIICGALVEMQSDGTMRFVHSSFRTFLASGLCQQSKFYFNERTTHIRCSTLCLSYLIYDLPSSSLYRTTSAVTVESLKTAFPFIEYSLRWVDHAVCGFKASDVLQNPLQVDIQDCFYTTLAKLINSPLSITVWIEAARSFRTKPSLQSLVALRPSRTSSLGFASPFNTGKLAITLIEELATDLERLDKEWGYLLKQDPSAIWGPSITAFCKSVFWVETDSTTATSLLPAEAVGAYRTGSRERPILIQSQVSTSGDEVGIVLVLPPRSYLATAEALFDVPTRAFEQRIPCLSDKERQELVKFCSSGWKFRYQRRLIKNDQVSMDFEIDLPESQIRDLLQQCMTSKDPHRFPFTVAFSQDLDRLIVLRSVLSIKHISNPESGVSVPHCRL